MFNRNENYKYEITHRISSPKIRRCQGPPKHIATFGTERTGVDCLRAWHCCATMKPAMNCVSFSENEAEMPTCVQGLPYYTNSSCGHWCTCGIANRAILSHRQTGLIQIDVVEGNICRMGWRSAPISWVEKDLHPPVASLERPVLGPTCSIQKTKKPEHLNECQQQSDPPRNSLRQQEVEVCEHPKRRPPAKQWQHESSNDKQKLSGVLFTFKTQTKVP